jgi:hypothetical protein
LGSPKSVRKTGCAMCNNVADFSSNKTEPANRKKNFLTNCVADPDLYVFGPCASASGSVSHKYRSGSGSFNHLAKIVRKT